MTSRNKFMVKLSYITEPILGYFLLVFSYLIPRNKRKILFGCKTGFMDNPKHLFLQLYSEKRIKCIWIANNHTENELLRNKGYRSYYKFSLKGLYHCLTGKYYVYSHYSSDINYWTSGNVRKIMLWHGVGIKKIGIRLEKKQKIKRILFPYQFEKPYIFLATSPMMKAHFMKYLHIPEENICIATYPRNNIFNRNKNELMSMIKDFDNNLYSIINPLNIESHKVYLYMPTFREANNDFIAASKIDFNRLNNALEEKKSYLFIKLHPFTKMDKSLAINRNNIIFLNGKMDIYPFLPFVHTLITDYSSIYFDFILMKNKSVILFPFDYNEYLTSCRDLAYNYEEFTPGKKCINFEDLLLTISQENASSTEEEEIIKIKQKFWSSNKSFADFFIHKVLSI